MNRLAGGKLSRVRILVECALLIALGTVLSLFKLLDLPAGGSVTLASMLPLVLLAYRHGMLWGIGSGLVYGGLQQLLGLNTLSYVTGWQSVLAVVLLDYVVAFALIGFGGVFRRLLKKQSAALFAGSILVGFLRYVCHVISGATVWAGLSIPTEAALWYSVGYNATYMVPETVILAVVATYLGTAMDFECALPRRRQTAELSGRKGWVRLGGLLSIALGVISAVLFVFPHLQNAESGEFDFSGIGNVAWVPFGIVVGAFALLATVLLLLAHALQKRTLEKSAD